MRQCHKQSRRHPERVAPAALLSILNGKVSYLEKFRIFWYLPRFGLGL